MYVEETIEIESPVSAVFSYVSHIENCTDWVDGCISAGWITPGEPGEGSVGEEIIEFRGRQLQATWTIAEFEQDAVCTYENEYLANVFGRLFERRRSTFRTETSDEGTLLAYQIHNEPKMLGRLLQPVLVRQFRRNMRKYLNRIKANIEDLRDADRDDGPLR